MSSTTGSRYAAGGIVATNAEIQIKTVQFVPSKITIHNISNNVKVDWFSSLTTGQNIKTIADGTRSVVASGGVEPLTGENPGIKIPQLADINDTTTELLRWEAWE